jgi:hypothetical protein
VKDAMGRNMHVPAIGFQRLIGSNSSLDDEEPVA